MGKNHKTKVTDSRQTRPSFNSKRVVMIQAHYEGGRYVPPVYIGDSSLRPKISFQDHIKGTWKTLNKAREINLNVSKRQGVAICTLAFLLFLLVGDAFYHAPIPLAHAIDYNSGTIGHTRTPIFTQTNTTAAQWSFNSTCLSISGGEPLFAYAIGVPVNQAFLQDQYVTANYDHDETLLANNRGVAQAFNVATPNSPSATSSDFYAASMYLRKVASPTGTLSLSLRGLSGTYGTSAIPNATIYTSASFDIATILTAAYQQVNVFFNVPRAHLAASTKYELTLTVTGTLDGTNRVEVQTDTSAPTHPGNLSIFDGTVWAAFSGQDVIFDVSGIRTDLGGNCQSASMMIMRSSFSLSIAASRMLEIVQAWNIQNAVGDQLNVLQLFLRTNSTLPAFSENWEPNNDKGVRLLWEMCVTQNAIGCTAPGAQSVFIPRDPRRSLNDENRDTVRVTGAGTLPQSDKGQTYLYFQTVLNFTGPTNFIYYKNSPGANTGQTTNDLAPGINLGVDYYLGLRAVWYPNKVPSSGDYVLNKLNITPAGLPTTLSVFSVPATCSETRNYNACYGVASPNPTPTFGIEILNPASWANAITNALKWAGTETLKFLSTTFGEVASLFINAFDGVGVFLGIGQVGTAILNILKGTSDWIVQIIGSITGQTLNFTNFVTSGMTALLTGVGNYWAGAAAFLAQIATLISMGWDFVNTGMRFSLLGIKWAVVVFLVWGIMASASSLDGFKTWFEVCSMLTIKVFMGLYWIGNESFNLILKVKALLVNWF